VEQALLTKIIWDYDREQANARQMKEKMSAEKEAEELVKRFEMEQKQHGEKLKALQVSERQNWS